jgi:predicted nucleotidyltransferase
MKDKLEKIKNIILQYMANKGFSTEKIIVFGSFAKGIETRESDIDIIIVSKNLRDKNLFEKVSLMSDVHIELVKKCKRPFDIMYYSDEEWKNGFSYIIKIAKKEGEVIFE